MVAACFSVWYVSNSLKLFRSYEILKAGTIRVVWVVGKDVVDWADGAAGGVLAVVGIALTGSIPGTNKFLLYIIIKLHLKGQLV